MGTRLTPGLDLRERSLSVHSIRINTMSPEPIARIRSLIAYAREQDNRNDKLSGMLEERARHLHDAISLQEVSAARQLAEFVARYIEQVPNFIEAISAITREAGIYPRVEPLLTIACDYFLSPPDIVNGHSQLEALLDEAYLAHRLLEEVNDRFIGYCGIPLAPMDMTRANVIAHELIGEPFANELDQAVLFSAELLLNQYRFEGEDFENYVRAHQNRGWSEELARWPCLAENLAIDLRLPGSATGHLH